MLPVFSRNHFAVMSSGLRLDEQAADAPVDSAPQIADDELLRRYSANGSEEAFSQIVYRHAGWVYHLCRRRLNDAHLAEDATQAVFLLLARKIPTMPPPAHLAGWLFQACRYVLAETRRNDKRYRHRQDIARDVMLQRTTTGIHKDDFLFLLNNNEVKRFGSQGQQKSFLIGLKLAEFQCIAEKKKFKPLLLLDDIFDKLDDHRIRKIMQFVADGMFGQLFITDARPARCATRPGLCGASGSGAPGIRVPRDRRGSPSLSPCPRQCRASLSTNRAAPSRASCTVTNT